MGAGKAEGPGLSDCGSGFDNYSRRANSQATSEATLCYAHLFFNLALV